MMLPVVKTMIKFKQRKTVIDMNIKIIYTFKSDSLLLYICALSLYTHQHTLMYTL